MAKLYNLFDGDKIILESVEIKDIRKYLAMPSLKAADYTKHNRLAKGKYRLTETGVLKPTGFKKEWQETCNLFRGVSGLDKIAIVSEEKK